MGALIVFEIDGRIDRNTGCGTAAGTVFRDSRDTAAGTGILPGGITGAARAGNMCRTAGDNFAVLALGFSNSTATLGNRSRSHALRSGSELMEVAGDNFAKGTGSRRRRGLRCRRECHRCGRNR